MARYSYDVNTTQRYIDVHKQFNGGLKTIDTDDALGAVFLRDADNVSISEFGFIEKRYGTHEIETFELKSIANNTITDIQLNYNSSLQGSWTYVEEDDSVTDIIIVDGYLYQRASNSNTFLRVQEFKKEGAFEYNDAVLQDGVPIDDFITFTFSQPEFEFDVTGQYNRLTSFNASPLGQTNRVKLTDIPSFNVLNKLKVNTNNYSFIAFFDETENYLGYYGSPQLDSYETFDSAPTDGNGNQVGLNVPVEIDLTEQKLGRKPLAGELFTIPNGAAYIQFFLSNSSYTTIEGFETSVVKYLWGQENEISYSSFQALELEDTIGGYTYELTSNYYPFQTTKEVSAVFNKKSLFIFNGTYPVYYKGDGIFYIFPIYRPNAVDLQNAGHNYLENRSYEDVYGFSGDLYKLSAEDNRMDPSLDFAVEPEDTRLDSTTPLVVFTQQDYYPKLPYAVRNQQKGELNFELNYNYSKETSKTFDPYLSLTDTLNEYTNTNYTMSLKDVFYAGANSASNQDFIRLNSETYSVENPLITNFNGILDDTINDDTELPYNNLTINQVKTRNTDGLFTELQTNEEALNIIPSQTHGEGSTSINTASDERGFLGQEKNHPYGIDQIWTGLNERDISISIHETIVRTSDSGNLENQVFGIRFKEATDIDGEDPAYQKLNWRNLFGFDNNGENYGALSGGNNTYTIYRNKDGVLRSSTYKKVVETYTGTDYGFNQDKAELKALDDYLSSRFVVVVRPILNDSISENKSHWRLITDYSDIYFKDGNLYFKMPFFEDNYGGRLVTGYSVHIKTINYSTRNDRSAMQEYLENYTGDAHRALRVLGSNTGDNLGLREIWPGGFGATRTGLDYNMFSASDPLQESFSNFGSRVAVTLTDLIPGNYDFKLTFEVTQNSFDVEQTTEYIYPVGYVGEWTTDFIYFQGNIVHYYDPNPNVQETRFYRVKTSSVYSTLSPYADTTNWEIVYETDGFTPVPYGQLAYELTGKTSVDTQYVSVYFRNITIYTQKIEDYTTLKEDGVSPLFSCTSAIEHYGKILLFNSDEKGESVFVSMPENFSYFPNLFRLDFNTQEQETVHSITPFMDVLIVQTPTKTWAIRGTSPLVTAPNPYSTFSVTSGYGTIAPKSVQIVRNELFFLSHLGVVSIASLYAIDGQYHIKQQDTLIKNIVPQDTGAVGIQFDNQYWLNFPESGITLRWYIDKKSWVRDRYTAWGDGFKGIFKYINTGGQLQFITLPSRFGDSTLNPKIYRIAVNYELPTDLTEPVVSRFETSYLNQNYPFHPKNYKEVKFDLTLQNEYNNSRGVTYAEDGAVNTNLTHEIAQVDLEDESLFAKNHRYKIRYNTSNYDTPILDGNYLDAPENYVVLEVDGNVAGDDYDGIYYILINSVEFNNLDGNNAFAITIKESGFDYAEFVLPDSINPEGSLTITATFPSDYDGGAALTDVTYDDQLAFSTWIISEDQTLNLDNYNNYSDEVAKAEIPFDLGGRLGEWQFGTTDFGNKVTAIKTIKLSGKGYNSKIYMEDYSRSKWTLESVGITYKMKRARSR